MYASGSKTKNVVLKSALAAKTPTSRQVRMPRATVSAGLLNTIKTIRSKYTEKKPTKQLAPLQTQSLRIELNSNAAHNKKTTVNNVTTLLPYEIQVPKETIKNAEVAEKVETVSHSEIAIQTNEPEILNPDLLIDDIKFILPTKAPITEIEHNRQEASKRVLMKAQRKQEEHLTDLRKFFFGRAVLKEQNQKTAPRPLVQHSAPNSANPNVTTQPNQRAFVITKELKDKSNTLSKQNSAKSIKSDTAIKSSKIINEQDTKFTLTHLSMPVANNFSLSITTTEKSPPINNENLNNTNKIGQICLEPISKLSTSNSRSNTSLPVSGKSALPAAVNQPVNLNAIFGEHKSQTSLIFNKDHSYLDPKLINKRDNLPVNLSSGRALKKSSTDSSEHQRSISSPSSNSSAPTSSSSTAHPISQLTESLPTTTTQPQPIAPSSNEQQQCNSTDERNLLKSKMLLERNQFHYDASPKADYSLADIEANRSSVEHDERTTFNQACNTPQHAHGHLHAHRTATLPSSFPSTTHGPTMPKPPPPPPPIFDDFGELLSLSENDDEQFPSLKSGANLTSKELQQKQQLSKKNNELQPPTTQSNDQFCNAPTDEQRKREIFISNKTEQNDLGRSPISPDSLSNVVGKQTMVEVEVNACANKYSKESDDDDEADEALPSSETPMYNVQCLPNVQLNNTKNLIQKMQDDFRHLGEKAGENLRQTVSLTNVPINNCAQSILYSDSGAIRFEVSGSDSDSDTSLDAGAMRSSAGGGSGQSTNASTDTPSDDASVDSDDMSSLDSYPISLQSSRRRFGSKTSADSAYGSLSRQRSSKLSTQRSQNRPPFSGLTTHRNQRRPLTANIALPSSVIDLATQFQILQQQKQLAEQQQQQQQQQQQPPPHYKYSTMKSRSRQFRGSSSGSGSDNSLPPIVSHNNLNNCNSNYQQQQQLQLQQKQLHKQKQQQQLAQLYNNNNNIMNNNNSNGRYESNNYNNFESPLNSPTGIPSTTLATSTSMTAINNLNSSMLSNSNTLLLNSNSSSNTAMSTSMSKMSKFCHECGNKFIVEHAKFCMDCGVKRLVL